VGREYKHEAQASEYVSAKIGHGDHCVVLSISFVISHLSFVISGPQRGFRQKGSLVVSFFRAIFNAGERFVSVFAR
jgi:hypothetical protein